MTKREIGPGNEVGIYKVYEKETEQIWNRFQRREAAQSIKFFINIDCLGTYDVE